MSQNRVGEGKRLKHWPFLCLSSHGRDTPDLILDQNFIVLGNPDSLFL
jgi:hypothetical protein